MLHIDNFQKKMFLGRVVRNELACSQIGMCYHAKSCGMMAQQTGSDTQAKNHQQPAGKYTDFTKLKTKGRDMKMW